MKTTLEIPEPTFRQAQTLAATQGITLKQFFAQALEAKLRQPGRRSPNAEPLWKKGFGALSDLKKESARIQKLIDAEFEHIEPEDRS